MKPPRIMMLSLNSGSGVERAGDTVASMLDPYITDSPENYTRYSKQMPPHDVFAELSRFSPDWIIVNEFNPRLMIGSLFYKTAHPKTKILFLNHCYYNLVTSSFIGKHDTITEQDTDYMLSQFMKSCDYIFNLNYHPPQYQYRSGLKVTDRLFPIDDKFRIRTPWVQRKKNFMYYGGLVPLKMSERFVEKLRGTDVKIDVYGTVIERMMKDSKYVSYIEMIKSHPNINYLGRIPEESLVETINQYRFFVSGHNGQEPFMLSLAESARCGTIPMIVNDHSKQWSYWTDWARNCILEYNDDEHLIEKMVHFRAMENNREKIQVLGNRSNEISSEMSRRTNYDAFRNEVWKIIFGQRPPAISRALGTSRSA